VGPFQHNRPLFIFVSYSYCLQVLSMANDYDNDANDDYDDDDDDYDETFHESLSNVDHLKMNLRYTHNLRRKC